MKNQLLTLFTAFAASPVCEALTPLGEHLDQQWTYDRTADQWTCKALTSGPGGTNILWDFNDVFLPLSDKTYNASTPANSGARSIQPTAAAYAFTGIAAGLPIWLAVQGTPGIGEAWPGFENAQTTGTFGEYKETDSRLSQPQTLARPWIRVALKSYIYQGTGVTPTYSMWTVSGSTPRIWMATADGIGTADSFLYAAGTHVQRRLLQI